MQTERYLMQTEIGSRVCHLLLTHLELVKAARPAMTSCTAVDGAVDPESGYPRKFERICKGALRSRYIRYPCGPPTAFVSDIVTVNEEVDVIALEAQFPVIPESDRASTSTERFRQALWNQLDSLRGFDDSLIRVDKYGNVLYRLAEPGSPLYGQIDHWFPVARGGLSVLPNLASIYWEANKHKGDQLEFLVPWYDLQCGVHFTRFISTFASTDLVLRQRMFALFFGSDGEAHHVVADWAAPSLSRTAYIASAVVSMDAQASSKGPGAVRQIKKGEQRRSTKPWTAEETAALQAAVAKHSEPGQRSLPLHKCREILAGYRIFRDAQREPKDLYDKWRNLQNQQSKGGTPRRSSANASSPCPAATSPAPFRRISYSNENRAETHSQARRLSWSQPPEHRPIVKGAAATCHSRNAPSGSPSLPRPPLGQRDLNSWRLEADFARACNLSDGSSDSGDELQTLSWRRGRDTVTRTLGATVRAPFEERSTVARPQAIGARRESLSVNQLSERNAAITVVDQNAGLAARLHELEGQKECLLREGDAAAQRREDLLCEVALVEQEVREHARTLEAKRAENEALADSLKAAERKRDELVGEWGQTAQRQRELAGNIREAQAETARKEEEEERLREEIQKVREGLALQLTQAEEALEEAERGLRGLRQERAELKVERDTLRKKSAACEEEKRILETSIKKLKEECEDLAMQLDLDMPALRQWQIRAAEAEQQSSLAEQREAAFQHDLQVCTERVEKLEAELESAREAAEKAERSAETEREVVARLQGRLKEVRSERKRAREECEELQLKRGVLEDRLREEELDWREEEEGKENERAAVEKVAEGLEKMRLAKGGGEVERSAQDALGNAEWPEDEGETSDAETDVLEEAGDRDTEAESPPLGLKEVDGTEEDKGAEVGDKSEERDNTESGSGDGAETGEGPLEEDGVRGVESGWMDTAWGSEKGGVNARVELDAESEDEEEVIPEVMGDVFAEDGPEQDPMSGKREAGETDGTKLNPLDLPNDLQASASVTTRAPPSPGTAVGQIATGLGRSEGQPVVSCSFEKATVDLTSESSVGAYTSADGGSEEATASELDMHSESSVPSLACTGCVSSVGAVETALSVPVLDERSAVECRVRGWLEALETESEGWDGELIGIAPLTTDQDTLSRQSQVEGAPRS
ncbi:hypothetical protein KFL_000280420 [Klebsormidium nitens]|uniref:Myb-like domain-containing protein n=1 Tax=Klebsormidium nitens TaxID=105231 RepID=A0A1Y1HRZ8_KLENI|nr:hypothetical protein KFL_000280420 [Klebsormidium nitens]|eukprot:GAQ79337.1 hypothetical protein KFL_000280420 [Klebsormidium nitens]